jgi:glutathione S-transferase
MSYRLYAHKNSYAMTTHLMLEELGVDYQVHWFNVHKPDEFPEGFLQLNPNGRVPVLLTDEGPVYESAATLMYLAEHHGNQFLPAENGHPRSLALQWLFYLMSTFQPEVLIQFHPERYFPDDQNMAVALKSSSLAQLEGIWKIIDQAFQPGPYFLGAEYGICDMLFIMQAIWRENQPGDLNRLPNTLRMMRASLQRPAVQRVMAAHEIQHLATF